MSLRAQKRCTLKQMLIKDRIKCDAFDFIIEKVFGRSICERYKEKPSAKIFRNANERTFRRQYHTGFLRTYELPNPEFFPWISKKQLVFSFGQHKINLFQVVIGHYIHASR